MGKFITFLLYLLFITATVSASVFYQEKSFNNVTYILPPHTNLELNEKGKLKSKYYYYFLCISDLSDDYYKSLNIIKESKSYHSKNKNGKGCNSIVPEVPDNDNSLEEDYKVIDFRQDPKGPLNIAIKINYKKILVSKEDINEIFLKIAKNLASCLSDIKGLKTSNADEVLGLSILKKLFESVPIPANASLSRYLYDSDEARTIMLLDPDIILSITPTIKEKIDGAAGYRYIPGPSFPLKFSLEQKGAGEPVRITQRPFLENNNLKYPGNLYPQTDPRDSAQLNQRNYVWLSSPEDIQMSSSVNTKKFISFYEAYLRENNFLVPGTSSSGQQTSATVVPGTSEVDNNSQNSASSQKTQNYNPSIPENPCRKPDNICQRSSYLLFSDQVDDFFNFYSEEESLPPLKPVIGLFSERTLIDPQIEITWQKKPKVKSSTVNLPLPIKTRLRDLKLYNNFKLRREYKGSIVTFINPSLETILLPGDTITY